MTLTPSQVSFMRAKLLSDIDSGEDTIIDERFVNPIWGSYQSMLRWCLAWNITPTSYQHREMRRANHPPYKGEPITWISFKHKDEQGLILLDEPRDDSQL